MRLFEFEDQLTIRLAKQYINENCQEFLSYQKQAGKFLYRGMHSSADIFRAHSPVNRCPRDNSTKIQKIIDTELQKRGFKALRSNSIFCTTQITDTGQYGKAFLIFPYDGFSFTWSQALTDIIYDDVYNKNGTISQSYAKLPAFEWIYNYAQKIKHTSPTIRELFSQIVLDAYKKNDPALLRYYFSRMISEYKQEIKLGKPDVFSPAQWKHIKDILSGKALTPDKKDIAYHIMSQAQFTNTDFVGALKSGHEIAINGEYIAISEFKWRYDGSNINYRG